jgi:outer membrane lipoprotein-sorting protein
MRKLISASSILMAICCSCAMAQLSGDSKVDDVLDALQASGHSVKSFSAGLKVNDYDAGTDSEVNRFGKLMFSIKPDGNPVLHVLLDHKQAGGKKLVAEKKEYLLDDGWLIDRDAEIKVETRRQVSPPGQKVDLFQLGKGPFPLPIGQDKAEVHKQFDVTKVDPAKDDPADSVHLLLKPNAGSPLAGRFLTVDVWANVKTQMPMRVKTVDDKHNERTVDFIDLKVNQELAASDLALPALPADWTSNDIPLQK